MAKPPASEQIQVNFRMPVDLRERIKAAAEESGRSLNAEIVFALSERYPRIIEFDYSELIPGLLGALERLASKEAAASGCEEPSPQLQEIQDLIRLVNSDQSDEAKLEVINRIKEIIEERAFDRLLEKNFAPPSD